MIARDDAHRVAAAELALREAGIRATVEVAGHDRDIAVVYADERDPLRVAGHAAAVKAAGFRYVTIDLGAPLPAALDDA
jgi:hypothetical protein